MAKQSNQSNSYKEILSDLQNKIYKPIYFLTGEESYYIDLISDYIQNNILDESQQVFDQFVLYGQDVDLTTVLEQARHFPMSAPYQVIIVKEAQCWKSLDELSSYLSSFQPQTILVICYKYKKADARKKYVSDVQKVGVYYNSEKIREDKLPPIITGYLREKGLVIEEKALMMLIGHIGNNLHKIMDELDKLMIILPKEEKRITAELIEKNVGISKEFNAFELTNALAVKDIYKVNFIVANIVKQKDFVFTMNVSLLFNFFSKLMIYHYIKNQPDEVAAKELGVSPYFLREYKSGVQNYNGWKTMEIISLLREYDMKSKGFQATAYASPPDELFKELIFKILH